MHSLPLRRAEVQSGAQYSQAHALAGLEGPEHPHLQKMLELFTTQWSSFVAKEKKVHLGISCTPAAVTMTALLTVEQESSRMDEQMQFQVGA